MSKIKYLVATTVAAVGLAAGNAQAQVEPVITPEAGYNISWTGTSGEFSGGPVPDNVGLSAGTAFGSSEYGAGVHHIAHANDGIYGNSNSWLSNLAPVQQYIGIDFGGIYNLTSIAWSRDNLTGEFFDRAADDYTLQITMVADAASASDGDWTTIGVVNKPEADPGEAPDPIFGTPGTPPWNPWERHEFNLSVDGGGGIEATALRILPGSAGTAIDEIELYGNFVSDLDPGDPDDPAVIPEPASFALLGLGGLMMMRRRRRA
ncbi:MAG: PEP-CTERM sorting domain-containing protein [Phycisphaeraceae bacterium]